MIVDFYLKGFVPLTTVGINEIHISTKEQINLFISQNGSGKSSIMRELNPFPPDSSKFIDGGTKKITLVHSGKIFILTSVIGKEGYHSFKVDNEELNTGCTATAQRVLAEQHFGMTQSAMRVLTGLHITDMFNVMSPARRKDFLMELYPNDTTYAMGVYTKLKEEFNNLRGALRNQIARYAIEKQTLETLTKMSEEDLVNKVNQLDDEIKQGLLVSGQFTNAKENPYLARMHESLLTSCLWLLKCNIANHEGLSKSGLQARIAHHEVMLSTNRQKQEHAANQLAEYQSQVDMKHIKQDPKVLEARIKVIQDDLNHWHKKRNDLKELLKPYTEIMSMYEVGGSRFVVALEEMKKYLINVTVASTETLTGQEYTKWGAEKDRLGNMKNKTEVILQESQHKLAHYLGTADIHCPSCEHEFKVGISKEDITLLQTYIETLTKEINAYETEIQKLVDKIDNDRDWFMSMQALHSFMTTQRYTNANLNMIVKEFNIGKVSAIELVNVISNLSAYDEAIENIKPLESEQQITISQVNLLKQNYIGGLIGKIKSTEDKLNWYNSCIHLVQNRLRKDKCLLEQMTEYDNKLAQVRTQLSTFRSGLTSEFQHQLKKEVDLGISSRTVEKNQVMSEIIRSKSMCSVVESIDQDIQRLKTRIKIVKGLMDGLCPNKGLIGKLMLDFIKTFCGNTNAIIKEFSNIPLLLKPCNKDNGDLTYRFPVVNGQNTEASDIAECSAGESEILNFVIRKVGMRYKPQWLPLFMDEVGVFLDEINRTRFFEYVQKMLADKEHEQLFMVSHYASQHGMFHNPNIVSLKHDGLTINGKVNTNTTIH